MPSWNIVPKCIIVLTKTQSVRKTKRYVSEYLTMYIVRSPGIGCKYHWESDHKISPALINCITISSRNLINKSRHLAGLMSSWRIYSGSDFPNGYNNDLGYIIYSYPTWTVTITLSGALIAHIFQTSSNMILQQHGHIWNAMCNRLLFQ